MDRNNKNVLKAFSEKVELKLGLIIIGIHFNEFLSFGSLGFR